MGPMRRGPTVPSWWKDARQLLEKVLTLDECYFKFIGPILKVRIKSSKWDQADVCGFIRLGAALTKVSATSSNFLSDKIVAANTSEDQSMALSGSEWNQKHKVHFHRQNGVTYS